MKVLIRALILAILVCTVAGANAGTADAVGLENWLMRLHDSARRQAYIGTFVVTAGDYMSSSRIWHVGDGRQQIERVESLTGEARSTYRRNDEVVTFLPESRVAIQETREALGLFPNLLNLADASLTRLYRLQSVGKGRVAGLDADIVNLTPADPMRFGYRIWTEQKTGLVIKLQTLDAGNNVLEQAAFSELQLDAPVVAGKLKALMDNTQGYQVRTPKLVKTTIEQEGWMLGPTVAGFQLVRCYKRTVGTPISENGPMQCIFSDGLASVSLFVESFDATRHASVHAHDQRTMGATNLRVRQLGAWWLTGVGEVPAQTLAVFVQALERKK